MYNLHRMKKKKKLKDENNYEKVNLSAFLDSIL